MKTKKLPHLLFLLFLTQAALPQSAVTNESRWNNAYKKLQSYVQPQLLECEEIKDSNGDNHPVRLVGVTSKLLRQYLPQYRLYVLDCNVTSIDVIFLLKATGEIINCGSGRSWFSYEGKKCGLEKIPEFLCNLKISAVKKEQAIAMTKLMEEIRFSNLFVGNIKDSLIDPPMLDLSASYIYMLNDTNWEYRAQKKNYGWQCTREYVGPTAQIEEPDIYDLHLDRNGRLKKIVLVCKDITVSE